MSRHLGANAQSLNPQLTLPSLASELQTKKNVDFGKKNMVGRSQGNSFKFLYSRKQGVQLQERQCSGTRLLNILGWILIKTEKNNEKFAAQNCYDLGTILIQNFFVSIRLENLIQCVNLPKTCIRVVSGKFYMYYSILLKLLEEECKSAKREILALNFQKDNYLVL